MIKVLQQPRKGEYLLGAFALLQLVVTLLTLPDTGSGEFGTKDYNPFYDYYNNPGILLLSYAAGTLNALIIAIIVGWRFSGRERVNLQYMLILFAIVAAILTWVELWYGSTFYYGEVRDKQGLPFSVNNSGPFGCFVFLTYIVWRIQWPAHGTSEMVVRALATAAIVALEAIMLRAVTEPWLLWQS